MLLRLSWARLAGVMLLVVGLVAVSPPGSVDAQEAGCTQFLLFDNASIAPTRPFQTPNDVEADAAGNVYVTDNDADAVYRFDSAGNQTLDIHGGSATPPSRGFDWPGEVAVDLLGNIYVIDETRDAVYGFDSAGTEIFLVNNTVNVPSPSWGSPDDIAVDSAGFVYVTDHASIYKFAPDGTQLFRFHAGSIPAAPFTSSTLRLAIDDSDNFYVAAADVQTVWAFRPDYTQFLTFGNSSADPPNPLFSAFGVLDIAADESGNIFVTDAQHDVVYGFRPDGTQFLTISNSSPNPPSPAFHNTVGLGTDPNGNVYVADTGGRVYGFTCPAAAGNVEVTVAASPPPAVCVTLDTTFIDFGTLAFGDVSAAVNTTGNNCGDDVDLTAAISDAAGTTAAWSPDNGGTDTCAVGS
ncbi:MAG: NHL repeat-containing protein, partial [Microthrixaceae bacterium]